MLLLALACSTLGQTMERAIVRCSRVLISQVSACLMGIATNSIPPQYFLRAVMRKKYFSVFSVCLLSHLRSLHNPPSNRMRVHTFLSTLLWSMLGMFSTPLVYMRSGVVPIPSSKRVRISSLGSTHGGIRFGADVHSASPAEAESPRLVYQGP